MKIRVEEYEIVSDIETLTLKNIIGLKVIIAMTTNYRNQNM